ncbi:hypothetical protein SDC9_164241 [bioreactor metagenome]|uniref:Uncharacterized protein n=1 Tax=bioreactor metagenome TaxID=1076179 RepID=A0A645FYD1_9ZZZZ
MINKTAVKVNVSADPLVHFSFIRNNKRRETLYIGIQRKLVHTSLLFRKVTYKFFKNFGSRIRFRVNRMAHPIN